MSYSNITVPRSVNNKSVRDSFSSNGIALRDYQKEAVQSIFDEFVSGVTRQLIVLPTGSGKTILMAAIAKYFNVRTLLLAHREELIQQAYDKIKLYWPEVSIGICMAERDEIDQQIVIGSIQSCSRLKRLERLKNEEFELLMIDESHHAAAESYQAVINALGFQRGSERLLIGMTATPQRSDKYGLGETFDKLTYSRSISTMIKAGYLSPIIGRKILTSFVLKKISTQNGDFAVGDLAELINTTERNDFIAEKYRAYASDRKGVAFCVDVQHCHDLVKAFNSQGISSKSVWGDMDSDERKQVLEELKNGKIQIVCSCGVLTEGFDEPSISCIAMARPTKSQTLYIQCVGRGLRLWPGKQNCLVLNFTDQGHNLDSVMNLSSTIPEAACVLEELREYTDEIDRSSKIQVLYECDREFDILGGSRFIWISIGENEWSLIDDEKREIIMKPEGNGYIGILYAPDEDCKKIVTNPVPLEYCSGICEDYARKNLKITYADITAPWMTKELSATSGQREYLEKKNAYKEGMSKLEASIEIRKLVAVKNKQRRRLNSEPLTFKQRYVLTSNGINPNNMSKLEAMRAISKLKQER